MAAYDAASLLVAVEQATAVHVALACTHEEVEDGQILVAEVKEEAMFYGKQLGIDSSWEAVEEAGPAQPMDEKMLGQVNAARGCSEAGQLEQCGLCRRQ